MWHSYFYFVPVIFGAAVSAAIKPLGSTVVLGENYYFVHPDAAGTIDTSRFRNLTDSGLVAVTVLNGYTGSADIEDELSQALRERTANDDVWSSEFLEVVIAQYDASTLAAGRKLRARSTSILGKRSNIVTSSQTDLPDGPYFVDTSDGSAYKGYRLYSDFAEAFTETLMTSKNGEISVLSANVPGQNLAVAVPSRMYYKKTEAQPLSGVRIGVKDIYDIKGIRTGDGNRAWYYFHEPPNATATAVQRLIDAGAVILGKMKTSQFANGETATADWVDYHEPFNPRGDGYQDTSSSSAGPGAGEASYPWIDITLGSDTGGSIRGPSNVQGLFGNRPSHGMVSLEGVMPLSPAMDTAGFLCRDPALWASAAEVLYGGLKMDYKFPKEILLYSGYPKEGKTVAETVLVNFAKKLEKFLSAKAIHYDISHDFAKNTPSGSPTKDIQELLNITYPILISQQQTRLLRDPFYKAYGAAHGGRRPFIDPVPLVRWGFGDSFPPSTEHQALQNKTIFAKWFNNHVLPPDEETCSKKVLIYVGTEASPDPRNRYLNPPVPPYGFSSGRISSFSGGPDYVFPLGEAGYKSTITDHAEVLPVAIDIVAHRHCDGMLFALANALIKEKILDPSVTGRSLVNGHEILFKRAIVSGPIIDQ